MTKERGGSLIFLAAGIYGLIFSSQLPFGRWNEPGPGVFPLALSILLFVSGVSWFIRGKGKGGEGEKFDWAVLLKRLGTPLKIVGLTLAYVVAFDRVGYLLTSLIYIFILFLWVSRYKLWIAAGLAIFIGAGSWLFFERLLSVQLPKGFLPL
jgi:putative tricarboxylic transport membrane protein